MNEKILTTAGFLKEQDTRINPSGGIALATDRPPGMSQDGYIAKYGTSKEKAELVKIIQARRALLPKFIYKICDKCGFKLKLMFGDSDIRIKECPDYCFNCNHQRFADGAIAREMTKAEIEQYEKDEAEKWVRINEREAAARLFDINQGRQKVGLTVFTAEQLAAADKMDWARKQEWRKVEAKRQAAWAAKKEAMQHKGEIQPKEKS